MPGEDFVYVKLSKRGLELAGEGSLSVVSGRHTFEFAGSKAQRVTRAFDWTEVLAGQHANGEAIFEISTGPKADK